MHQSCDHEFNVAFRKNYRKIIALISPLETVDFMWNYRKIIAKLSQNYRKIFAKFSQNYRTHFPIRNCRFLWNFRRNYRTSALYKLLDRSLKTQYTVYTVYTCIHFYINTFIHFTYILEYISSWCVFTATTRDLYIMGEKKVTLQNALA